MDKKYLLGIKKKIITKEEANKLKKGFGVYILYFKIPKTKEWDFIAWFEIGFNYFNIEKNGRKKLKLNNKYKIIGWNKIGIFEYFFKVFPF
jgi:hypothetical protein